MTSSLPVAPLTMRTVPPRGTTPQPARTPPQLSFEASRCSPPMPGPSNPNVAHCATNFPAYYRQDYFASAGFSSTADFSPLTAFFGFAALCAFTRPNAFLRL